MKTIQKTANVLCYVLSLPLRVVGVILAFPVVLSNVDWTMPLSRQWHDFKDDLWDILKYPHA